MDGVDFTQLRDVFEKIADSKEKIPEIKRDFLDRTSSEMLQIVRGNIASSLNDANGHVQSWQQSHVGSRNGYAAVRAEKSGLTGRDSTGATTNYLEHGHKTRSPSGTAKRRYRPRIKFATVKGRFFYKKSQSDMDKIVKNSASELSARILKEMGFG